MASYAVEIHQEDSERAELPPIGSRAELRDAFLAFNTAAAARKDKGDASGAVVTSRH